MPKLDDVSWHLEAAGLPEATAEQRAGVHIGLFLAWIIDRGHWQGIDDRDADAVAQVRARQLTGTQFLLTHCDGKLYTAWFTPAGERFAKAYYPRHYSRVYARALQAQGLEEYQVTEEGPFLEPMARALDLAFEAAAHQKPWWRFW